jgi:hypothetical protein
MRGERRASGKVRAGLSISSEKETEEIVLTKENESGPTIERR